VGIFDSGMGGFPVAAAVRRLLPSESILYLADIAHRPYGPRPAGEVALFARAAESFFHARGAKAMVVACNTASVVVDELDGLLPTVGMVRPAVEAAAAMAPRSVGLLGTLGTVASGVYQRHLAQAIPGVSVVAQPCEAALRLAELGGGEDQELLSRLLAECLEPVAACQVTLLACTDFTCVRLVLDRVNRDRTRLLDPAESAVTQLRQLLEEQVMLSRSTQPQHRFCVTEADPAFAPFARDTFGLPVDETELVRTEVMA
jgi:glutamate racemase